MSTYLANFNITFSNDTSNVMLSDVNMLRSFIKHLILCKANTILTVTKYYSARRTSTKLSLQATEIAIYSASVVDKATVTCMLVFQLTTHHTTIDT